MRDAVNNNSNGNETMNHETAAVATAILKAFRTTYSKEFAESMIDDFLDMLQSSLMSQELNRSQTRIIDDLHDTLSSLG